MLTQLGQNCHEIAIEYLCIQEVKLSSKFFMIPTTYFCSEYLKVSKSQNEIFVFKSSKKGTFLPYFCPSLYN